MLDTCYSSIVEACLSYFLLSQRLSKSRLFYIPRDIRSMYSLAPDKGSHYKLGFESAHTHQYINQETKKYSHYCTLLVGVKNDSVVDWLYSSYGMER